MSGCAAIAAVIASREPLAVDGQRRAGRHAALFGGAHDERSEPPHFFFQEADGVIELVAAEGVAADELGEPVGLVDGGRTDRPHLVERDRHAARGRLPGRFAAGEPPPTIVTGMSHVATFQAVVASRALRLRT